MVALYRFISHTRCIMFLFLKIFILLNYNLWIKALQKQRLNLHHAINPMVYNIKQSNLLIKGILHLVFKSQSTALPLTVKNTYMSKSTIQRRYILNKHHSDANSFTLKSYLRKRNSKIPFNMTIFLQLSKIQKIIKIYLKIDRQLLCECQCSPKIHMLTS